MGEICIQIFAFSPPMSRVLLLDLDHTLYPSTLPTAYAVDARITDYIERHLGLVPGKADALRQELCTRYGTTLKGLETLHGVNREHYCDFIQDVEDVLMPPPDPRLREWLLGVVEKVPTYLFTNARRDWADRCLACLGLSDLLIETQENGTQENSPEPAVLGALLGILDIGFMGWVGKPDAEAFSKTESFIRRRHGDVRILFADDRLDNLAEARRQGWSTIWIRPHDMDINLSAGHRTLDSLLELDVEELNVESPF
jgi:pyrimidine 5'-nucleotidase